MPTKHFKLKPTVKRQDLFDIGVCSDHTFDYLLSGQMFTADEVTPGKEGRNLVWIDKANKYLWVYEDMVDYIDIKVTI